MDKFEEYFRTPERYQDCLCWGSDKWIFKSVDGRYLSEEIQRMYELWQHQQAKVEELQTLYIQQGINMLKLQKWVDAVKGLAQTLWEKSTEKHKQGKVWESKALGECADEILDVLEQALKGDQYDEHRKKAEEAISKGASLTNHRIEL